MHDDPHHKTDVPAYPDNQDLTAPEPKVPWFRLLNRYHWFVFLVCCLAWDMDCMDQQLFVLARRPAMSELVAKVSPDDGRLPEMKQKLADRAASEGKAAPTEAQALAAVQNADIQEAAGFATSIFMI